jgi:hypothetical protein
MGAIETEYDLDVAGRRHHRTFHEEAALAFSALDCVLNGRKGIYASSELTTGRHAYQLAREHGVGSIRELREALGEDPHRSMVLGRNMEEAGAFARRLQERLGGDAPVITPAPFLAPGWSQAEYLHFWAELIRTRAREVHFNDAWQYSNGCTLELAVAYEAEIPTFDASGEPLPLERGIEMVADAMEELAAGGFDVTRLRQHLDRLRALG